MLRGEGISRRKPNRREVKRAEKPKRGREIAGRRAGQSDSGGNGTRRRALPVGREGDEPGKRLREEVLYNL
jgi:hypothetical protein